MSIEMRRTGGFSLIGLPIGEAQVETSIEQPTKLNPENIEKRMEEVLSRLEAGQATLEDVNSLFSHPISQDDPVA